MEKTDTIGIANVIKDIILQLGFDSKKLRDQCHDGCATMMEKNKGVATQIKNNIQSLAFSMLNLACGDWIRNAVVVSNHCALHPKLLNW